MTDASSPHLWLPEGADLLILGVTGGIASGKSTVARMLEELGAPAIDFDLLARDVVAPGQPAYEEIVAHFGNEVIREDKTLDRKRLSAIVFRDPAKRRALEGMTHPRILTAFGRRLAEIASKDRHAIVQAVVPLLYETHLESLFHRILVVYVPPEVQIERLMRRDGILREEAERILKAQIPIDVKAARADFVIYNKGSLDETRMAVKALWHTLTTAGKRPPRKETQ